MRDAGYTDEALQHLFDAGDDAGAGQILAQEYMNYIVGGRREAVLRWFERIPFATMRTSNVLCLARAYAHLQCNRLRDTERWLEVAPAAPRSSQRQIAGFFPSFESAVALAHSGVHYYSGNVSETLRWSERAHDFVPVLEGEVFLTTTLQASAQFHNGDDADAVLGFDRDRIWAASVDYHLVELNAAGYLAVLHVRAGEADRGPGPDRRVPGDLLAADLAARREPGAGRAGQGPARSGARLTTPKRCSACGSPPTWRPGTGPPPDDRGAAGARRRGASARTRLRRHPPPGHGRRPARDLSRPRSAAARAGPAVKARRRRRNQSDSDLTERQIDVLRLVAQGMSNAEVAAALDVSERTVHAHLRALFDRIGARNRTAAVRYAVDHDLL